MANSDRVALFNDLVGRIFVELCRSFPSPTDINLVVLAKEMGAMPGEFLNSDELHWEAARLSNGDLLAHFFSDTVRWLIAEGFIRSDHGTGVQGLVLTAKAFTALNMVPEGLKERRTVARRITAVEASGDKKGRKGQSGS